MMSFNAPFANPLQAAQHATPVKADTDSPPSSGSVMPSEEAVRYLQSMQAALAAASGAVPNGANGMPPGLFPAFLPGLAASGAAAAAPQGLPFPLFMGQEVKSDMLAAPGGGAMLPFLDAFGQFHPYGGLDGARRKNATRETTAPLKTWLSDHRRNPYPTKAEKVMLAVVTKMTLTQVSTWFANARRRLKKENKMTWSPRNRPGEDDDDLADLERPGSSNSNSSDHNESNNNDHENHSPLLLPSSASDNESPRKLAGKIWSISDTIGVEDDEATSSKKDSSPASSASAASDSAASLAMQQQQQIALMMARQMMAGSAMSAAAAAGGPPPSAAAPFLMAPNAAILQQFLMASMMGRMGMPAMPFPAAAVPTSVAGVAADPISSLSPSSSTHSDADKPPTLTDARVLTPEAKADAKSVLKKDKSAEPAN